MGNGRRTPENGGTVLTKKYFEVPMTMEDWAKRLDIYLQADDLEVLKDAGKISAQLAKMHAETEFEKYRVVQDRLYQSDFDRYLEENL